jgi:hypothetical protein
MNSSWLDKERSGWLHAYITLESMPKGALLVIAKVTMARFPRAVFVNLVLPYRAPSSSKVDQFEPEASGDARGGTAKDQCAREASIRPSGLLSTVEGGLVFMLHPGFANCVS